MIMIGIYKIVDNKTGIFYVGASSDIARRFREHKCSFLKKGKFDCSYCPGSERIITEFSFEVVELCELNDLFTLENKYLKSSDPSFCINTKLGTEQKSHRCVNPSLGKHWYNNGSESKLLEPTEVPEGWVLGRITGINGIVNSNKDNLLKGNEAYNKFLYNLKPVSNYINTTDENIKILSNNEFVPLRGILKNNKKVTTPLCNVIYLYKTGVKRCLGVTIDHPLVTDTGRKMAQDLTPSDFLIDSITGDLYPIIDVIQQESKCETYDVETDNDVFDLSGILSHNCRTRVIGNTYDPSREIVTGRGNLSFTSINLPRIAIESKKNINVFFRLLDSKLKIVSAQLMDRFALQCDKKIKNYPFLMGQGVWIDSDKLNMNDDLTEVLSHGTLSIGFIGLAETLKYLTGKHHAESESSQKLGLKIIKYMRDFCDQECLDYNLNYSLLATPAEGLSGRFVNMDRKKYGVIKGVTDRDYYTNSFHVPVYYPISIKDKLDKEAPYHALTNAGHISYVELDGDPSENLEAFEKIIRYMKEVGIGYGSINHPVDRDPVCGYIGIIGDTCPNCGRHDGEALTPEVYRDLLSKNKIPKKDCFLNVEK